MTREESIATVAAKLTVRVTIEPQHPDADLDVAVARCICGAIAAAEAAARLGAARYLVEQAEAETAGREGIES